MGDIFIHSQANADCGTIFICVAVAIVGVCIFGLLYNNNFNK